MKLIATTILSLLILSNSLKLSAVYGWYVLDLESFIEELCENKDRPELQCNGQCYLSKMAAASTSNDQKSMPVLEWDQLVFYHTPIDTYEALIIDHFSRDKFYFLIASTTDYFHSIFHPPQA